MSDRKGGILYPVAKTIAPSSPGALERTLQNVDALACFPAPLASELAALALRCADPSSEQNRPRFVEVVRALRPMMERFPKPGADADWMAHRALMGMSPSLDAISASAGGASGNGRLGGSAASSSSASPSGPGAASVDAPFFLEVVAAEALDASALPASLRRLQLSAVPGEPGRMVTAVGRQHQPEFFEAWLPDPQLLQCVSRTAFEVVWTQGATSAATAAPRLVLRGANDVSVDGQVPSRSAEGIPLAAGAEIGFPYTAVEGDLVFFLRLRFRHAEGDGGSAVAVGETAPLPRLPAERLASGPASWTLRCVHAEGFSKEELARLGPELCDLCCSEADPAPLAVGRQHQQRRFDALLGRSLGCMSFISRTHMRIEAHRAGVQITNLSQNPVYIDRGPLSKGESRSIAGGQVVSFARLEGNAHVLFLSLMLCAGAAQRDGPGSP